MKHFQYLFRLFVALTAILTARAVYAQQEVLPKIDVIRLDSRFDKLVPSNSPRPTAASRPKLVVRIENITKADALTASNGVKWSLAFSPGLAVVHTDKAPIFTAGKKDRGKGLEAQAEDGNPATLAKSLESDKEIKSVVVFNTPMGQKSPGRVGPGAAYECSIEAAPGSKLAVTSMFGQSNDLFYAPNESGIALFNNGKPIAATSPPKLFWGTPARR